MEKGGQTMIQYVLFDFDGTLVDSKEAAFSILNQLAQKYRFKRVEKEDIESLRRLSIAARCRLLNVPIYKIPLLAMESRHLYKGFLHKLRLFDGIKGLLEALKVRGFNLAVLSSNSESNIRAFLLENQIDAIQTIYSSANIFGKDAAIKKFLKAHKLPNSQVIYVGDEQRDIIACRKSGIQVIWVGWGYDSVEAVRQAEPDFIVHSPEEILSILQTTCI